MPHRECPTLAALYGYREIAPDEIEFVPAYQMRNPPQTGPHLEDLKLYSGMYFGDLPGQK